MTMSIYTRKPRWKTLVELIIAIIFAFVGVAMFDKAVHGGLLWDVVPPWLGMALGLLVMFTSIWRIKDRWSEL